MRRPLRVKICCIQTASEAAVAIEEGATDLGFVSRMPSGPGVITEEAIAEIVSLLPKDVPTWLLTSGQSHLEIIREYERTGCNTIQLTDRLPEGDLRALRFNLSKVQLVQVIHVRGESAIQEAITAAPLVDMLLLDSGNPTGRTKSLGGTGRTHDWRISREIVRSVSRPVFLAGGLHARNVTTAISEVAPNGIDVCTGVRTNGSLDRSKLRAFIGAALPLSGGAEARPSAKRLGEMVKSRGSLA